jgi:hypothetical protein
MTTWTPEPINHLLPLKFVNNDGVELSFVNDAGEKLIFVVEGDLWNEEPVPTDTWRRRLG